jgi:hypothetical protein
VRRNKIIHVTILIMIPVAIYGCILIGKYWDLRDENQMINDNLQALFLFMLVSRIALMAIFVISGILLLRSLKTYSLKIYRFSKCKVGSKSV